MLVAEANLQGQLFSDANDLENQQRRELKYMKLLVLVEDWQEGDKTLYPLSSEAAVVARINGEEVSDNEEANEATNNDEE